MCQYESQAASIFWVNFLGPGLPEPGLSCGEEIPKNIKNIGPCLSEAGRRVKGKGKEFKKRRDGLLNNTGQILLSSLFLSASKTPGPDGKLQRW